MASEAIVAEKWLDGQRYIVRQATQEDYAGILAINDNVYAGMDYLPHKYSIFLGDPRYKLYVLETNGKIIAFRGMKEREDTVVSAALRIHPSYEGKGLIKFLIDVLEKSHRFRSELWATVYRRDVYKNMLATGKARILAQWNYLVLSTSREELSSIAESDIQPLSAPDAARILCDESNWGLLFGGAGKPIIFGHEWSPYRVCRTDMRHIAESGSVMVRNHDTPSSTANHVRSVVWHGCSPLLKRGYGGSVMYYGAPELQEIVPHLLAAFRQVAVESKIKRPENSSVMFFCHLLQGTDADAVAREVKKVFRFDRIDTTCELLKGTESIAVMSRDYD